MTVHVDVALPAGIKELRINSKTMQQPCPGLLDLQIFDATPLLSVIWKNDAAPVSRHFYTTMFPSGNTRAVLVAPRLVGLTTNPCSSFSLTTKFPIRRIFSFGGRIVDRIFRVRLAVFLLARRTLFFTPLFLFSFFDKVLQFCWDC